MTLLAAALIASPLVVLALRSTRWDPLDRPSRRPPDGRDADARRLATDVAAVEAHDEPAPAPTPVLGRPAVPATGTPGRGARVAARH